MLSDPRMAEFSDMPFDGQRMISAASSRSWRRRAAAKQGYADGFVVPVPAANKRGLSPDASKAAAIFEEYGATRVSRPGATIFPKQGHRFPTSGEARKAECSLVCVLVDRMAFKQARPTRLAEADGGRKDEADFSKCPSTASMFWGGVRDLVDG